MTLLAVQLLLAYALGSVSGSLLLGRLRGADIRTMGSGNAGATNALRAFGWPFALAVVGIDIGKGVIAAAALPLLGGPPTIALWCGLAAVVGHIWPIWHGFRGGKGGATGVGVVGVVLPYALAPVVAVWLVTLGLTGYVALATMLAAVAVVPAAVLWAPAGQAGSYLAFALALAVLVVFAHRSNVVSLWRGEEYCFEKARVLRPGGKR